MKYVFSGMLIFLAACSIRAAALVETGEATLQGSTSISRQQDKVPEKQNSLLENIIQGYPNATPTPSLTE